MKQQAYVFAALTITALSIGGTEAFGQAVDDSPLLTVEGVELVSPRYAGPPVLVLLTEKGELRPAAGVYRSADRTTITVKDGRIVAFSDPESGIDRFQVASVDQVAVRDLDVAAPGQLFLRDARGRTLALPDGAYTSGEGLTLLIRHGTIVAYGTSR